MVILSLIHTDYLIAERQYLSYCGMYCCDCLGRTGVIADAAKNFLDILDEYEFEKTAFSVFPSELAEYDNLIDMLMFMENLRCTRFCREIDGGESKCEIRIRCVEHGYYACNSCDDFETCEKLEKVLGGLHLRASRKNLMEINKMGLNKWIAEGEKHQSWDREE